MTDLDKEVERMYENGKRSKKILAVCWPLAFLFFAITTFFVPLVGILGLIGTAIKAYND